MLVTLADYDTLNHIMLQDISIRRYVPEHDFCQKFFSLNPENYLLL